MSTPQLSFSTENNLTEEEYVQFWKAVYSNDIETVKSGLMGGADPNSKYYKNKPIIYLAVERGHAEMFQMLLKSGADPNSSFKDKPVIYLAVEKGRNDMLRMLLESGADPNSSSNDKPVLIEAILMKNEEAAIQLLREGADQDSKYNSKPFIFFAIENGNKKIFDALIAKGVNVNVKHNNYTPLMEAIKRKKDKFVVSLVGKGADVNEVYISSSLSFKGTRQNVKTAIGMAIQYNRTRTVGFLLQNGADVNALYSDKPILIYSVERGMKDVVLLLLEHGADTSVQDHDGNTALHTAIMDEDHNIARIILRSMPDMFVTNNDGQTALDLAREEDNTGLIILLEALTQEQVRTMYSKDPSPSIKDTPPEPRISKASKIITDSSLSATSALSSRKKKNAVAIVIGVEKYRRSLPDAEYATNDAQAVTSFLTSVLGFPEANVVTLLNENATKSDFEKYFEKWLENNVEKDSFVFIYYSGHGAPNPKTGESYLVPYDGDPAFLEQTGYPLERLYSTLGKLKTDTILVALDSCFSGAGDRSVIAPGLRPIVVKSKFDEVQSSKIAVMSAASGSEVSSTYREKRHGLFTYFFLKGLKGYADINEDGNLDVEELHKYLEPQVRSIARKKYNNEQSPQLVGEHISEILLIESK